MNLPGPETAQKVRPNFMWTAHVWLGNIKPNLDFGSVDVYLKAGPVTIDSCTRLWKGDAFDAVRVHFGVVEDEKSAIHHSRIHFKATRVQVERKAGHWLHISSVERILFYYDHLFFGRSKKG